MSWYITPLKFWLTHVGSRLPEHTLVEIQAAVNYLKIGRWMRNHQFAHGARVPSREAVWRAVLDQVKGMKVLYLEFGVAYGDSMRHWSRELVHPEAMLHGFDSFEGLPEGSGPWRKGQFDADGKMPQIEDSRVRFFKGWFDRTLPSYSLPPHEVLVINMDADIYSSTIYVLRHLRPYIKAGTFIYFDEMNHIDHEPRAFDEFVQETGLRFECVCADKTFAFVFLRCLGV